MRNKGKLLITLIGCMIMLSGCGVSELLGDIMQPSGVTEYVSACNDYAEGNYESALEKLKRAEKLGVSGSTEVDLYSVMGNTYFELADYEEAIVCHEKAVELAPDSVVCIVNLAVAHRKNGNTEKAKELYNRALEIDPDYAELNSSLGSLYILENEPELAIKYFEKAISQDDTLAVAYGNAALAYAMTGDFEKAEDYLNKAIVRGYDNVENIREMIDQFR